MAAVLSSVDILQAKQRRLHQLELQASRLGYSVPPEIANEIADLRRELVAAVPATIAESHDILYDFMSKINVRIDRLYWWTLLMAILIILAVKL